jgi:glycosyltransferase involved in cell wall biosynthesis
MNSGKAFTIARLIARLNVGGPAMQAVLMTEAFLKKGYRALLLTGEVPPGEGSMEYLARERGVQPIKISKLSRKLSPAADLKSLWRLIRLFRRERPMILHTHTAKAGTLGRLAAMVTGVPVRVHTFHGHVFSGYFSPGLTRIFLAIERFLGRHTDCIIAVSSSQRKELVETYRIAPRDKVVTIPLGFDLDRFLGVNGHDGSIRAAAGCSRAAALVGWIGRMTAIKAPAVFLDSAVRIRAALPSVQFVMVGDGELREDCEARIRQAGLHGKVVLAGWKRDLSPVYADLDLLLLTSINEGTPLTLLEAMASGRSFIATNVGGVRDLMIGTARREEGWERFDNGILVSRDPRRIAEAAQYLLLRPELRREMGRSGREFVRNRYSCNRLAADLEHLYVRLARKKKCLEEGVDITPFLNQQLSEKGFDAPPHKSF